MATQNDHSPSFKRACLFYSAYKTPQLIFCEYVGVYLFYWDIGLVLGWMVCSLLSHQNVFSYYFLKMIVDRKLHVIMLFQKCIALFLQKKNK